MEIKIAASTPLTIVDVALARIPHEICSLTLPSRAHEVAKCPTLESQATKYATSKLTLRVATLTLRLHQQNTGILGPRT